MSQYQLRFLGSPDTGAVEFKSPTDVAARADARRILAELKLAAGAELWRRDARIRTLMRVGVVPYAMRPATVAAPASARV